jgi:hypothetical protein
MRMKFENLKDAPNAKFRRITGVKRSTFNQMVDIIQKACEEKRATQTAPGGRKPKLSVEDHVLMTLEYFREYRTYAHIGASYGLSETRTFENICWVENVLIKSKMFSLPGKKALLKTENEFEVILIDATESPIERPKKNSANSIPVKRSDIQSKHKLS